MLAQHMDRAADDIERAREIVRLTQHVLDGREVCASFGDADLQAADAALSAARRALCEHLQGSLVAPHDGCHGEIAALLLRSELAQVSLKDAILARHTEMVLGAQEALGSLRGVATVASLAERAPAAAHRMGFSRILFSRIRDGNWIACSAWADEDEEFAQTMVAVGAANPRRLSGPLMESEMVRRGVPILVRDPQSNPRVHPELAAVTKTAGYVAAPVSTWGRPIGLLHADRSTERPGVHEVDRDVLAMFAEGLGLAFERNLMMDRLQAMRRAADEHLRAATALADDFTLDVMDRAGSASAPVEQLLQTSDPLRHPTFGPAGGHLRDLTAREIDVLRGMAAGQTNAQVALSLFVAEGTVKSHVKHILRKLGAANRTDAVTKYHQLGR
ncbi:LuxR C-terminal-related transcriptional regulator [Mycobacterium sp. AZCC_0083]|uniref:LuxR C-terminal-related transcriptional regulator n=1 Tax=Mycobacterium sp. AZCC_0083 TaxID=2735882 RepID=UPI00160903FA|nr:LuxR C-terminal-related transcriptional regulator [Mycobacterium sp. AZCC_0083]MBB5163042.1 DNA-binding CsgD family transcriptional regulator [Mycobacterium sp. AZCC_0083]